VTSSNEAKDNIKNGKKKNRANIPSPRFEPSPPAQIRTQTHFGHQTPNGMHHYTTSGLLATLLTEHIQVRPPKSQRDVCDVALCSTCMMELSDLMGTSMGIGASDETSVQRRLSAVHNPNGSFRYRTTGDSSLRHASSRLSGTANGSSPLDIRASLCSMGQQL
jgi:hypothetical protein